MAVLSDYMKAAQRLIRDSTQVMIDPGDLIEYANRARREIAGRTQCIRVLTPIYGSVTTVTVAAPGANYAQTDTFNFAPPDSPSGAAPFPNGRQATGSLVVGPGGIIQAIDVTDGGDGYFTPSATITTSTGSGCTFSIQTSPLAATIQNQEVYNFSSIDLSRFPGVGSIMQVRSVAIIYANYRYVLPKYPWTTYQAFIRQYPRQYYYVPTMCSQFGQGINGSMYMYPVASQPYQLEFDSTCLPLDLQTDLDVEAIPLPWSDAIPYYMAWLAFSELQNLNAAEYWYKKYEQIVSAYSSYARGSQTVNPYGRW